MDIGSREEYPAGALSNFNAYSFVFDGVKCASMEGLLQSLKYENPTSQLTVCGLWGGHAKKKGARKNKVWKKSQTLYWKGEAMDRHGPEYQKFIQRAFTALAQNGKFQHALLSTGDEPLTHSHGRSDPRETILTEAEFCDRLTEARSELKKQQQSIKIGDWVLPLVKDAHKSIYLVRFYDEEEDTYCCQDLLGFPKHQLRLATQVEIDELKMSERRLRVIFNQTY